MINPKAKRLRNAKKPQQSTARRSGGSSTLTIYRHVRDMTKVIRTLRSQSTVATNGTGVIAAAIYSSTFVTADPNFANISQEFQDFRVRSMKVRFHPVFNMAYGIPGTNAYPIVTMFAARFWEHTTASLASINQAPDRVVIYGTKPHIIENNYAGYLDAQLWNDTLASIPTTQAFGIAICSPTGWTAFEPSTAVFNVDLEFVVEFMGAR